VTNADPWDVVLEVLDRPVGRVEVRARGAGGLEAAAMSAGNAFDADIATVRCLKQRSSGSRRVYFVTFDGSIPARRAELHSFDYVVAVHRDKDGGWRAIGAAGGAGGLPPRPSPWINLAGGSGGDHFYAGGRIDNAGVDIKRVRLSFADGVALEDDAENGVALFITDGPVSMPAAAELYDSAGERVARNSAFPTD
jgi:hypothetical protein